MRKPDRRNLRWRRAGKAAAAGMAAAALIASVAVPASAALNPFPANGTTPTSPPGSYTEQVLASNGDNAIDPVLGRYYRIVAMADLGNGVLLAAYDGRPDGADAPSANSIVQRRSTDNGASWGAPTYIARGQESSAGSQRYGFSDPSYVVDKTTGTVFNFHVYSKNQGFGGSVIGNDDTNVNVISSEVSVSTDGGVSWSTDPANQPALPTPSTYSRGSKYADFAGPLITNVVKPNGAAVGGVQNVGGVVSMFASSGEGIQLKYGAHAGRLIQQFAGKIIQPNGSTTLQAYSVYSDDHGRSWQMGTPTGTGMDENKAVELSNGNVMLNSRDSAGGHGRKTAISTDGGASYGAVSNNASLIDPTNNAGLTRMYPAAPAGSADAKKLLFSNAASTSSRSNGTVRYSCDDGASWSSARQFKSGAMSYSTITALSDGTFGVLYEGDSNTITFGKFDQTWLAPLCASVTAAPASVPNGASTTLNFSISNKDSQPLPASTLSLQDAVDWTSDAVHVPAVPGGATVTIQLPVTSPSYLKAGNQTLTGVLDTGTGKIQTAAIVTITGGATANVTGAYVYGQRKDAGRDLAASPYTPGDAVPYKFRIYSAGNITESVRPISGNFAPFIPADGGGNCRFGALAVGASYVCSTPKHTVTATEAAQGYFVPTSSWVTGADNNSVDHTLAVTGEEVDLLVRNPRLTGTVSVRWTAKTPGWPYAAVGDTIDYSYTVTNTGNVALSNLAASGISFSQSALGVGESATATSSYAVTAADIAAGHVAGVSVGVSAENGAKSAALQLTGQPTLLVVQPAKPGFTPELSVQKLKGTAPVDLGLGTDKYRTGQTVTVHNAGFGQWYYVYLNKHSTPIGWYFPNQQNSFDFVLPADAKNGMDDLVVLDSAGHQLSFGAFQVTPSGSK
ncbi:sialidase family protein [Arthrobacter sp. H14-L1]|uniref:sialidase family protein n=1 Tax=Arthrobacter sp. H14-L1 TaxID=2996697 RepID=UPI00226F751C|nr:sialidase family protein [Arthrobacter sp. H14-L1]MCY0904067.1 sialidase family protein [Arthrobacter sp. H14-L1]